jgi:hypothetical protein
VVSFEFDADALAIYLCDSGAVATWDQGNGIIECPHCGAQYEAKWMDYPARDKGIKVCDCCGLPVIEWNGTRDYSSFVLVKAGSPKT